MTVRLDGARGANAVAAIGGGVATVAGDHGGRWGRRRSRSGATKNGMMYGEAVVYVGRGFAITPFVPSRCDAAAVEDALRRRAAQRALLHDDLGGSRTAVHSNAMARLL